MGCKLGKLAASSASNNTGKLDDPPPPAPTDPRLPLTAKQKYNMLASWKGISRAMESGLALQCFSKSGAFNNYRDRSLSLSIVPS
ncbi:hypothetical protein QE152_g39179 [Popillia japonica]|uniref:Uncharacterized protein n=1 Tax=Popillia japonica TaxID=7064 RepID=A0AAW1HUK6_POPJA